MAKNIFTRFNRNMRVNFSSYNFTFKSKPTPKLPSEGIEMGIDGYYEGNEWRRTVMDDCYALAEYHQYYELPKSEEEMNRMLKSWGLEVDKFTEEIKVPSDLNVEPFGNNNNWRGAMTSDYGLLEKLKESGIKCIIDLTESSTIAKSGKDLGLEYLAFPIDKVNRGFWFQNTAFMPEEKLKLSYIMSSPGDFINKLIELVKHLDNGNCYIGCEFGVEDTNNALRLYKTFSPEIVPISLPHLAPSEHYKYEKIRNLFDNLTYEDKKALGWSDELIKHYNRSNILRRLHR